MIRVQGLGFRFFLIPVFWEPNSSSPRATQLSEFVSAPDRNMPNLTFHLLEMWMFPRIKGASFGGGPIIRVIVFAGSILGSP